MYAINVFVPSRSRCSPCCGLAETPCPPTGGGGGWRSSGRPCALPHILGITLYEKFLEGGWVTVLITLLVIGLCLMIRRHYRSASARLDQLYRELGDLPAAQPVAGGGLPEPARGDVVAAILVESYGGVGIHTMLNTFRAFPNHFKGLVFVSVGVIDSGEFKGEDAVAHLQTRTEEMLARYRGLAAGLGMRSACRMKIGTEAVSTAEELCLEVGNEFPRAVFVGKLIFRPKWRHRMLHNETAQAIRSASMGRARW
jgi:hypothetical protein